MKITRTIPLALLSLFASFIMAQDNIQGVKISMEKGIPHENAMLEVEIEPGQNKGLLLPQVTNDPNGDGGENEFSRSFRKALMKGENGDASAAGMIIYASPENQNNKGVWYYDGEAFMRLSMPPGSIIMFSGSLDGKFDENGVGINEYYGWAMCNGYKGSEEDNDPVTEFLRNNSMNFLPDLRGRFVVGATESVGGADLGDVARYKIKSTKDNDGDKGETKIALEEKNLPDHTHMINVIGATQVNTIPSQTKISINMVQKVKFKWSHATIHGGRRSSKYKPLDNFFGMDSDHKRETELSTTGDATLRLNNELEITGEEHTHVANILENPNMKAEPFENRPPFYVVAYIIKVK